MSQRSLTHQLLSSIFLLSMILLIDAATALAQGTSFTYQGRLTQSGNPADGLYDMQFKLFDTAAVGTGIQQGPTVTNASVQVTNGVFSVELDFSAGVFDGSARFLEIGVRPTGSADPHTVLSPRQPLTATPYAILSGTATNATLLGGSPPGGFIQNGTSEQAETNFSISGNGTLGGTLSAGVVNATTQYNINGNRLLSVAGANNLFVGVSAGASNTKGSDNSFFGSSAGNNNTEGGGNSFFGASAGFSNTTGFSNSFFGNKAGFSNTEGGSNSFFGRDAGFSNTEGDSNSFFGRDAGFSNTTGGGNSFFGSAAGNSNTTGGGNSFFGDAAGSLNTEGSNNSFFGSIAGFNNTTGSFNSFFGGSAGASNTTGFFNSFFGGGTGAANTSGSFNSFFGMNAGNSNTEGSNNSFFGVNAGFFNTTGFSNSFFGNSAGSNNTVGGNNSFFGWSAGLLNTTGVSNSFFGRDAGALNTAGSNNSSFGNSAGFGNTTGEGNTFIGSSAGQSNTTGSKNTFIGADTHGAADITNATAIGADVVVSSSNTMVLGTSAVTVRIPGSLIVTGTVSKGGGSFKIDHPLDPENKTLSHSFVESPDMMNIYNGNAVLDRRGEAVITLPAYFESLNRDFRYHLTCIGGFAPVYIAQEIKGNRFKIAGGKPGMKISWQVTGVRQDAYANAHRIPVEEEKPASERGSYLHPDAFDKTSIKQARASNGSRAKQKSGKSR